MTRSLRRWLGWQREDEFEALVAGRHRKAERAFALGQAVEQSTDRKLDRAGGIAFEPVFYPGMVKCRTARADGQQDAGMAMRGLFAIDPYKVARKRFALGIIQAGQALNPHLGGGAGRS